MQILENFNLLKFNTFHINAKAKYFVQIFSEEDLFKLIQTDIFNQNKFFILGGGANILFTQDFDGLVIKISIPGKEIIQNNKNQIFIKVGAGKNTNEFILRCLENDFAGLENLIYIPGQIGATVVQNIGAYGSEIRNYIYEVQGLNLITGKIETLNNSQCLFSYRDSIFKHELKDRFIITYVTFQLQAFNQDYKFNLNYKDIQQQIFDQKLNSDKITIKDLADIITDIRKNKLPDWTQIGTAGSFFKNPVISSKEFDKLKINYPDLISFPYYDGSQIKLSAGQLIEMTGLKGLKKGEIGIYPNHALVLLNYGNGTSQEIVNFADNIITEVKNKFDIILEPEVIYV